MAKIGSFVNIYLFLLRLFAANKPQPLLHIYPHTHAHTSLSPSFSNCICVFLQLFCVRDGLCRVLRHIFSICQSCVCLTMCLKYRTPVCVRFCACIVFYVRCDLFSIAKLIRVHSFRQKTVLPATMIQAPI